MENYEQKYKEALSRAKGMWEQGMMPERIEYIFPELAESEDEQHRKWVLEYLYDGMQKSDEQFKDQFKAAIAWLEKQGDEKSHCWTIQDAKDGDVLALNNEYFLFKGKKNSTTECYISHCFIDSAKTFRENGEFLPIERGNKVCPATKEQHDLLFQGMKEAGYEWDAEKKELKKIGL